MNDVGSLKLRERREGEGRGEGVKGVGIVKQQMIEEKKKAKAVQGGGLRREGCEEACETRE